MLIPHTTKRRLPSGGKMCTLGENTEKWEKTRRKFGSSRGERCPSSTLLAKVQSDKRMQLVNYPFSRKWYSKKNLLSVRHGNGRHAKRKRHQLQSDKKRQAETTSEFGTFLYYYRQRFQAELTIHAIVNINQRNGSRRSKQLVNIINSIKVSDVM